MAASSPSLWLAIAAFVLPAIVVHPGFAALCAMAGELVLLALLRWAARREGLLEERAHAEAKRKGFA